MPLERSVAAAIAGTALLQAGCGGGASVASTSPSVAQWAARAPSIAVRGNELVTTSAGTLGVARVRAGAAIVLRGVNFSGAEYACLQQHSFWDNPRGNEATVRAMLGWHSNVVRIPLNEECWLGINGAPRMYSGARYARAIADFVRLANARGLIAEVDLHFGAGGSGLPTTDRYPGLDQDHAPAFWRSVARTFEDNDSVIFNLINEPYITSWSCFLRGACETPRVGKLGRWKVVGTQSVVDEIRATGATNPIIVAGLDFSNDLTQWLRYAPIDPAHAIVAGAHVYFDLGCEDTACWTRDFGAIQRAGYPVIVDEFGELDCAHAKIDRLMTWADARHPQIGYWAWSWNPFGCSKQPSLITDDAGGPTHTYGSGFESHLKHIQP
ncbi:MAG: cellulase family glycosylhydrolase [Candidatus Eremiobacteraeota bacterium]|nr:cellulase family glycosylhydrolase [Candidatus Eremiobacteraeota bacterium]